MLNKFEAVGIGLSIAIMMIALYLLRIESNEGLEALVSTSDRSKVVTVEQSTNREGARFDTLSNAVGASGMVDQVVIDDIVIGSGEEVSIGDTVSVHYIGTLQNGQEFDNSNKRGEPFVFTVGRGQVIEGWDIGLVGMKVGGQRVLVIPPEYAYGNQAVGPIPRNATLVFAIELLSKE